MSYASLAASAIPQALQLLEGTVSALPHGMEADLFRQTLALVDLPAEGLGYEHGILQDALSPGNDSDKIQRARDLYRAPGRLVFVLAPRAAELSRSLGVSAVVEPEPTERTVDLSAALAWARMAQGAATLIDRTALWDPIGDLAVAVRFMDQRGLAARWAHARAGGDPAWIPPPSFAFLGQGETPGTLAHYNLGGTKRLGDVAFGFDPALRSVVPPRVYADLVRAAAGLQFVIPASHVLDTYFTEPWARSLPENAVVATGIKGFSEGKTVREYIDSVFAKVGRASSPVGIYGYMPARRWMQEQRGERPKSDGWNILLTDPSMANGFQLALRWAGPEAKVRHEFIQGIPVMVVENLSFDPPLRITILADEQVIRANELASVYKNLQALHLGRALFEKMRESVTKGERWSHALQARFRSFYQEAMDRAKGDILKALGVEGIPELKRILMPDVEDDMYGSWGTEQFKEMYELVWQIFHEHSEAKRWQEGMVLLKLKIGDYYSVRNPCYGFCLAADEAAIASERWMSLKDVEEAAERLRDRGRLIDAKGKPLSERDMKDKLELDADPETHYFFSMIPAGLRPEALQIAEQLPVRYGRAVLNQLPESFRSAHLSVERIQHKIVFDSGIYREIVDLTKILANVFPGSPDSDPKRYAHLLGRLLNLFRAALRSAAANERALGIRGETTMILHRLVHNLEPLAQGVLNNDRLTAEHVIWLNQAMIEALTAANLLYILPPEERQREALNLLRRIQRLRSFVNPRGAEGGALGEMGTLSLLFPNLEIGSPLLPEVGDLMQDLRSRLYTGLGTGLIELTYQMNLKLHRVDRAIVKKDIDYAVTQMEQAVVALVELAREDSRITGVLSLVQGLLSNIRARLEGKKLGPKERVFVFQALIDALVQTRRFLVFPDDRAAAELGATMSRFEKIQAYLEGRSKTPLWSYGNGSTPPPPPAISA